MSHMTSGSETRDMKLVMRERVTWIFYLHVCRLMGWALSIRKIAQHLYGSSDFPDNYISLLNYFWATESIFLNPFSPHMHTLSITPPTCTWKLLFLCWHTPIQEINTSIHGNSYLKANNVTELKILMMLVRWTYCRSH